MSPAWSALSHHRMQAADGYGYDSGREETPDSKLKGPSSVHIRGQLKRSTPIPRRG
jgi:hypothetical protein